MNWFEALVLGLVQGLTEFLPVSSSGHLTIGQYLFGVDLSDEHLLAFDVAVHVATVCATIIVFRRQIWDLLCGLFKFKYNSQTQYILKLCVSMIPVFVVGMFFKEYVESIFGSGLLVVGIALLVTAALLTVSEIISARRSSAYQKEAGAEQDDSQEGITYKSAFIIGLAQAVAVIPGLSRSGSTIATGLLCGVKKSSVAQFSFLMVLVPVLGEAFLDLVGGDFSAAASATGGVPLLVGFMAAFVSGLFACKVMISLVRKARLRWFALYCVLAAVFCLVVAL